MEFDGFVREEFRHNLQQVKDSLHDYREVLDDSDGHENRINDIRAEHETVQRIEECLARIMTLDRADDWILHQRTQIASLEPELEILHQLTSELPSFLHQRMSTLQGDVRMRYRTWIVMTWFSSLSGGSSAGGSGRLFSHLGIPAASQIDRGIAPSGGRQLRLSDFRSPVMMKLGSWLGR
jgi:hypothetical protein